MASGVTIRTQPVTRAKLAQFLDSHELIKLLENLTQDVSVNLPGSIDTGGQQIQSIAQLALLALNLAGQVQDLAEDAMEATAQVNALRDRLATLERAVAEQKEGPTP